MPGIIRDLRKLRKMSDTELFAWRRKTREMLSERRSKYLTALYEASNTEFCARARKAWSRTE